MTMAEVFKRIRYQYPERTPAILPQAGEQGVRGPKRHMPQLPQKLISVQGLEETRAVEPGFPYVPAKLWLSGHPNPAEQCAPVPPLDVEFRYSYFQHIGQTDYPEFRSVIFCMRERN
jgi:hypothetical protein